MYSILQLIANSLTNIFSLMDSIVLLDFGDAGDVTLLGLFIDVLVVSSVLHFIFGNDSDWDDD